MKYAVLYALALIAALLASVVLAVLGVSPAHAAEVLQLKDSVATVTLHDGKCKNADLATYLRATVPGESSHAMVTYHGLGDMQVTACWVLEAESNKVILADEMGNAGFLMRDAFKAVHAF